MQNTPLTRYQLVRTFIYIVGAAWIAVWYLTTSSELFFPGETFTNEVFPEARWASLFSPVTLLIVWPLLPVFIKAVAGNRIDAAVTSARDLKSLLLPCVGMMLFLMALVSIGFEVSNQLQLNNVQKQYLYDGPAEDLPPAEPVQFNLIERIQEADSEFVLHALLLITGIPVIAYRYIGSRQQAAIPIASTQETATSLTRFEIARAFLYVVLLGSFICWLLVTPLELQWYKRNDMLDMGRDTIMELCGPLVVLLLLPFVLPIAFTMTAGAEREPVEHARQLRSLVAPCIGALIFVWVLRGAPSRIWFAYDEAMVWELTFRQMIWPVFGWPIVNSSVGLGLMVYPYFRGLVRALSD